MKKLVVVIVCITFLMEACRTGRPTQATTSTDSTYVRESTVEVVKDSFITIPPDSSWFHALLACDSNGQVLMKKIEGYGKGKNAEIPRPTIQDNRLFIVCDVDSFQVYQQYARRFVTRDTTSKSVKERIITLPPVKYTTAFQKFMIKSGWALWIILILYIAYRIIKFKLSKPL